MLVKEVIGECLVKLGKENFIDEAELTDEQQALVDRLLAALNIAYKEAVTEFIPLYCEEDVTVSGGVIDISGLSRRILYPVALSSGGRARKVWVRPEGLSADAEGRATLRYAYLPEDVTLSSDIADMRLTAGVLSDGVIGEYYLADKVFEIAEAYETSFREALSAVRYKGRPMTLGAGRWRG